MGIFIITLLFILFFIYISSTTKEYEEYNESIKTVTTLDRGTRSERDLILKLLKFGISSHDIFHDLYVEKYNGHFSQIDLVILTEVGVIVVEVKDYSGWIFGSGNKRQWTKVLAYGKERYRFYNPIMQNSNHILELRKKLRQFKTLPFYSCIVFYGDCKLKNINCIPQGTFILKSSKIPDIINSIINNKKTVNFVNKNQVTQLLRKYVENGKNIEIQNQHIKNIKLLLKKNNATI